MSTQTASTQTAWDLCVGKRELVTLPTSSSVGVALRTLHENQIQSVPLVSKAPHDAFVTGVSTIKIGDDHLIGIISILDLVAHVFRYVAAKKGTWRAALETPCWRVLGSTDESLSLWMEESWESLEEALTPFACGVHRAIVIPREGDVDGFKLLTQTDILTYLLAARSTSAEVRRVLGRSLGQLGITALDHPDSDVVNRPWCEKVLMKCTASSSLVETIGTMVQRNVHAVAVVDDHTGLLLSTFSVSDLRGLNAEQLESIAGISVGEFLEFLYEFLRNHQSAPGVSPGPVQLVMRDDPSSSLGKGPRVLPPPLTCRSGDTLGQVVDLMLRRNVHRAWLVDSDPTKLQGYGLPVGVVTYTDVIRIIYDTIYRVTPVEFLP